MSHDWRVLPEHPNFSVNELGDVMHTKTGIIRKAAETPQGHRIVFVNTPTGTTSRSVAQLVAQAFLGPPRHRSWTAVIHINGNLFDCRAENLAWRTRAFAIKYHKQFSEPHVLIQGRRGHHYYEPATGERFANSLEAAARYGILADHVYLDTINGDATFPDGHRFVFEKTS